MVFDNVTVACMPLKRYQLLHWDTPQSRGEPRRSRKAGADDTPYVPLESVSNSLSSPTSDNQNIDSSEVCSNEDSDLPDITGVLNAPEMRSQQPRPQQLDSSVALSARNLSSMRRCTSDNSVDSQQTQRFGPRRVSLTENIGNARDAQTRKRPLYQIARGATRTPGKRFVMTWYQRETGNNPLNDPFLGKYESNANA